ncbi:MAG: hypothetical protein ABI216_17355 [Devosia sp.]
MPNRFDKFVHDENLKDFGRQIEIETDPTRLALLKILFREEQDASSAGQHGRDKAGSLHR